MNLNGDECFVVSVNGPGGTSMLVTVDDIRAGVGGYKLLSDTGGLVLASPSISTYFLTQPLIAAVSVLAPPDPPDGMLIVIANASSVTFSQTITLTQSPGQTVMQGGVTALVAGASAQWQHVGSIKTWLRLR